MENFIFILDGSACQNPDVLKVIAFIFLLIRYVYYLIPIGLIVMCSIDLVKCVISGKDEEISKYRNILFKRILYSVVVFLVPILVKSSMNLLTSSSNDFDNDYTNCLVVTNMSTKELNNYITIYQDIYDTKKILREQELDRIHQEKLSQLNFSIIFGKRIVANSSSNSGSGNYLGQTYQLKDQQLKGLTKIAIREQGENEVGIKAAVTVMANLFEKNRSGSGGGDGLYSYVRDGGWFGRNNSFMDRANPNNKYVEWVKDVLVNGNRTMPLYIDEFDCIDCGSYGFDITKIETDGKVITSHSELKKHSNYFKDKTVIHNRYGSVYTFYTFPTPSSDPFGYTKAYHDKVLKNK